MFGINLSFKRLNIFSFPLGIFPVVTCDVMRYDMRYIHIFDVYGHLNPNVGLTRHWGADVYAPSPQEKRKIRMHLCNINTK